MNSLDNLDSETLQSVISVFRQFSSRELIKEQVLSLDEKDHFPEEILRRMLSLDLGFHLIQIPAEYGGFGGRAVAGCRMSEAMAEVELGIATAFLAIFLGIDPIRVGATDEQKQRWLTRIAEEGLIVAYGVTEPSAGSDVSRIKTKAVPVTSNGKIESYRISGEKTFITNGGVADIYTILTLTPGGASFFFIERDTPGLEPGRPEKKHGIRLSNTTSVLLDEVLVPVENLIGGVEGQGFQQAQEVFGYTRLMVASMALGAGKAALDKAIAYSAERKVGAGIPLNQKQGYTHKLLVPHYVALQAARSYIEESARRLDEGEEDLGTEGAIAKHFTTEVANAAADASIQALGGYGYIHEYEIEKIRRDVRITKIYEGTSEILQNIIAWERWKTNLISRDGYYVPLAQEMERIGRRFRHIGANIVASAAKALASSLNIARSARLSRQQHLLFRLADVMTWIEVAATTVRTTADRLPDGLTSTTVDGVPWAAISRVMARDAAAVAARELAIILLGPGAASSDSIFGGRRGEPDLAGLWAAQEGVVEDLDQIAVFLRERD